MKPIAREELLDLAAYERIRDAFCVACSSASGRAMSSSVPT